MGLTAIRAIIINSSGSSDPLSAFRRYGRKVFCRIRLASEMKLYDPAVV
jgi:hypothetical protein